MAEKLAAAVCDMPHQWQATDRGIEIRAAEYCDSLLRVAQMRGEMAQEERGIRDIVIVHEQQHGGAAHEDAEVLGGRQTARRLPDDPQRQPMLIGSQGRGRLVGRAIIDGHDLEPMRCQTLVQQPVEHTRQQMRTIPGRQDDGDLWRVRHRLRGR